MKTPLELPNKMQLAALSDFVLEARSLAREVEQIIPLILPEIKQEHAKQLALRLAQQARVLGR